MAELSTFSDEEWVEWDEAGIARQKLCEQCSKCEAAVRTRMTRCYKWSESLGGWWRGSAVTGALQIHQLLTDLSTSSQPNISRAWRVTTELRLDNFNEDQNDNQVAQILPGSAGRGLWDGLWQWMRIFIIYYVITVSAGGSLDDPPSRGVWVDQDHWRHLWASSANHLDTISHSTCRPVIKSSTDTSYWKLVTDFEIIIWINF